MAIWRLKKIILAVLVSLIAYTFFALPHLALAQTATPTIDSTSTPVASPTIGPAPAPTVAQGLVQTLNSDSIKQPWKYVLSLVDALAVLVLIAIAIANILRINLDLWGVRRMLPALIIGLILANFSYLIMKILIDFANVLTMQFMHGISAQEIAGVFGLGGIAGKEIALGSGVTAGAIIGTIVSPGIGTAIGAFLGIIVGMIIIGLPAIAIWILAFLLLVRTYVMWFLIIISPIAFFAAIFTPLQKVWQFWQSWLLNWLFMPAIVWFIIRLAVIFNGAVPNCVATVNNTNNCTSISTFGHWAFGLCMFFLAMYMPFKLGGFIMSGWAKLPIHGAKAAMVGRKITGIAAHRWGEARKMGGKEGGFSNWLQKTGNDMQINPISVAGQYLETRQKKLEGQLLTGDRSQMGPMMQLTRQVAEGAAGSHNYEIEALKATAQRAEGGDPEYIASLAKGLDLIDPKRNSTPEKRGQATALQGYIVRKAIDGQRDWQELAITGGYGEQEPDEKHKILAKGDDGLTYYQQYSSPSAHTASIPHEIDSKTGEKKNEIAQQFGGRIATEPEKGHGPAPLSEPSTAPTSTTRSRAGSADLLTSAEGVQPGREAEFLLLSAEKLREAAENLAEISNNPNSPEKSKAENIFRIADAGETQLLQMRNNHINTVAQSLTSGGTQAQKVQLATRIVSNPAEINTHLSHLSPEIRTNIIRESQHIQSGLDAARDVKVTGRAHAQQTVMLDTVSKIQKSGQNPADIQNQVQSALGSIQGHSSDEIKLKEHLKVATMLGVVNENHIGSIANKDGSADAARAVLNHINTAAGFAQQPGDITQKVKQTVRTQVELDHQTEVKQKSAQLQNNNPAFKPNNTLPNPNTQPNPQ